MAVRVKKEEKFVHKYIWNKVYEEMLKNNGVSVPRIKHDAVTELSVHPDEKIRKVADNIRDHAFCVLCYISSTRNSGFCDLCYDKLDKKTHKENDRYNCLGAYYDRACNGDIEAVKIIRNLLD